VRFSEYKMLSEHKQALRKVSTAATLAASCIQLAPHLWCGKQAAPSVMLHWCSGNACGLCTTYDTILASPRKHVRFSYQRYLVRLSRCPTFLMSELSVHLGAISPLSCRHCHTCSSSGPGKSAQTRQHCSTPRTLRCCQLRLCSCQRCG
jgi:hypothetical protein